MNTRRSSILINKLKTRFNLMSFNKIVTRNHKKIIYNRMTKII